MEALLIGLALSFNILVILWKIKHRSLTDGLMDALLLGVVMYIAGGTIMGTMMGTVASFVVSTYLLIYPFDPIRFPTFRLPRFRLPRFTLPKLQLWTRFKRLFHLPTITVKWS